jgi:hypothetical protein
MAPTARDLLPASLRFPESRLPGPASLPCIQLLPTYHEHMDSPTFDALQRIMDRTRPQVRRDRQLMEDWLRVTAWMDEVATDIDNLETLGTGDPCRELREVR